MQLHSYEEYIRFQVPFKRNRKHETGWHFDPPSHRSARMKLRVFALVRAWRSRWEPPEAVVLLVWGLVLGCCWTLAQLEPTAIREHPSKGVSPKQPQPASSSSVVVWWRYNVTKHRLAATQDSHSFRHFTFIPGIQTMLDDDGADDRVHSLLGEPSLPFVTEKEASTVSHLFSGNL